MSFKLISSILHGAWFIEERWANAHLPLIHSFIKGEISGQRFGKGEVGSSVPHVYSKAGLKPAYTTEANTKFHSGGTFDNVPDGSIAVIRLHGPVTKFDGDCGEPGAMTTARWINEAVASPKIIGVLLDIDSPGGEGGGATVLADTILSATKPIVAWVADGGAFSAAYWAASQADEVYTRRPDDSVGSIGGYITLADYKGFYEQKGIRLKTIYAPQSTDKNKVYIDAIENDDDTAIKTEIKFFVDGFIAAVANGRKGKLSSDDWKTGKTYFSKEAQKLGLIDGMATFEKALERVSYLAKKNRSQKSNNMSQKKTYSHLAATAGWEDGYETTDEGLFLSHNEAGKVEGKLAELSTAQAGLKDKEQELAAAQANLTTSNNTITEKETRITELTNQLTTAKADAADWKKKAEDFGAKPSNDGTTIKTEADNNPEIPVTTAAEHPYTKQAREISAKRHQK